MPSLQSYYYSQQIFGEQTSRILEKSPQGFISSYFRNSLDSISCSVDCCCSIATQAARSGVITLSQPLQYVCPLSSLSMATLFHIRLISQIKLLKKNMARKIQSLVSNLMPSTRNHIGLKVKEGHLQIAFEYSALNSQFK